MRVIQVRLVRRKPQIVDLELVHAWNR